jgi:hypothetical protein
MGQSDSQATTEEPDFRQDLPLEAVKEKLATKKKVGPRLG